MSNETLSLIVWCRRDLQQQDTLILQLARVDTGKMIQLREGIFLLRLWTEENTSVERCLIRHLSSGRETYIQGSTHLRAFVKDCLLNTTTS